MPSLKSTTHERDDSELKEKKIVYHEGPGDALDIESFNEDRLQLEKTTWRKLDMYILPIATMFYLMSFLVRFVFYSLTKHSSCYHARRESLILRKQDRSNIGNARVAGLQKDLKMSNTQVRLAISCSHT
jgi:hypothetical protein